MLSQVRQMRRRAIFKVVVVLTVAVAAVTAAFLFSVKEPEPKYEGKGIREWTVQLSYGTAEQIQEARVAMKAMGQPAVPYLIRMLKKEDSRFDTWIRKTSGSSLWYDGPANYSHAIAATALRELGSEAQNSIPALEKVAGEREYVAAYKAKATLTVIRNESIAGLAKTLEDRRQTNWSNWVVAASLASELGDSARPLIPLFIEGLGDTNWRIRWKATSALGSIALEPEVCVPAILRGLGDTNRTVLTRACLFCIGFRGLQLGRKWRFSAALLIPTASREPWLCSLWVGTFRRWIPVG